MDSHEFYLGYPAKKQIAFRRTSISLDYFDPTSSRTTAWVIGARSIQKALPRALLLPQDRLKSVEAKLLIQPT